MTRDGGERPEALTTWTELCEVVDQVRIRLNRDLLESAGLTLAENLALCQVAMSRQRRLRMVDLADRLVVARSAVTKTVDRLEQRGLLRRERDARDRRTVYAVLTADGERVFELARVAYLDSVRRHFAGPLGGPTLRQLRHLSERVLEPPAPPDRRSGLDRDGRCSVELGHSPPSSGL